MRRFSANSVCAPQQRGISVITAIFLLLLMALLAAGIVAVVSTMNLNMAADIGGSRAYQAARSGAEWGMYQLDPNATGSSLPSCWAGVGKPAIPGHDVAVTCASTDFTESAKNYRVFQIFSTARATGVGGQGVERVMEVRLEKCRYQSATDMPDPAPPPYDCR